MYRTYATSLYKQLACHYKINNHAYVKIEMWRINCKHKPKNNCSHKWFMVLLCIDKTLCEHDIFNDQSVAMHGSRNSCISTNVQVGADLGMNI